MKKDSGILELGDSEFQNFYSVFYCLLLSFNFRHFRHFFSSFHNLILDAVAFELFMLPSCSFLVLESADQKS